MYKTIIMPVDVFEMELSDKAVRHAEFLAQDDGVIHLLHVLPGSASLSLHRFAADVRRFEEHLQHEAEERLQTMVSHGWSSMGTPPYGSPISANGGRFFTFPMSI